MCLVFYANLAGAAPAEGFDTDEFAQVTNVTARINVVQSSPSLHSHSKRQHRPDHSFDNIVAIGLTTVEMKNLGVDSGQILTVESQHNRVAATVFKLAGESKPPTGMINLSTGAARKLRVRAGESVFIHRPGDTAIPEFTKKVDTVKINGKMKRSNF
jgi:hypothetical protein